MSFKKHIHPEFEDIQNRMSLALLMLHEPEMSAETAARARATMRTLTKKISDHSLIQLLRGYYEL